MAKSKSSSRWLQEHHGDLYVKRSKEDGYRSRASYKLIELDNQDAILTKGMTVIDLGAAPGGWSQIAVEKVGDTGVVIASDILPMDSLAGVEFVQGDFTEEEVLENILTKLGNREVDLVISDMAPNMSGVKEVDIPRAMLLVELAIDLARQVLRKDGSFVTKVFQGEGYDAFIKECRTSFKQVKIRKPESSRARSREVYIVAKGYTSDN